MLRTIRRKLQDIRYHSALPAQSGWTAAADVALLAALLLAWPATWACDRLVTSSETAIEVGGQFGADQDGLLHGRVPTDGWPAYDWETFTHRGRYTLRIDEVQRGWPFITTIARQRAVVDLDLFKDPQPRFDVTLDEDDPMRAAILSGLDEAEEDAALAVFRDGPPEPESNRINWIAGTGVWWIMLSFGLTLSVRLVQFGSLHWNVRRERRRLARLATGRCAECGYDLRGLEFNERCPECGGLVE